MSLRARAAVVLLVVVAVAVVGLILSRSISTVQQVRNPLGTKSGSSGSGGGARSAAFEDPMYDASVPSVALTNALSMISTDVVMPGASVMGQPTKAIIIEGETRSRQGIDALYSNGVEFKAQPGRALSEFESALVTNAPPPAVDPSVPYTDGRVYHYEVRWINGVKVLYRRSGVQTSKRGGLSPVPPSVDWRDGSTMYWLTCAPDHPVTDSLLLAVAQKVVH